MNTVIERYVLRGGSDFLRGTSLFSLLETPTNLYLPESTILGGIVRLRDFKIARIALENETFKVFLASCPIGFCLQILVTNSMGFD